MATATPPAIAKYAAPAYSPEAGKKLGEETESVVSVIEVLTTDKNVAGSLQRVRGVSIARELAGGERAFNYLMLRTCLRAHFDSCRHQPPATLDFVMDSESFAVANLPKSGELLDRVYQAGFSFTDMSRLPGASRQ